jgi:hypothetical protein
MRSAAERLAGSALQAAHLGASLATSVLGDGRFTVLREQQELDRLVIRVGTARLVGRRLIA